MLFQTGLCGQSVKFNPFNPQRLAVCLAQNFAIVGNGRLLILDFDPNSPAQQQFRPVTQYPTQDALLDCSWNELNANLVVAGCGDGSIKVYDVSQLQQNNPIKAVKEHQGEVQSVSFNMKSHNTYASASWDQSVKIWDVNANNSIRTFQKVHEYCIYQVVWNPRNPNIMLTASGDTSVKILDMRQQVPSLVGKAHDMEVLAADWCKYNEGIFVTGSVDKTVRVWDVRNVSQPRDVLYGHTFAVRKVTFSPWNASHILSCSYDMTVRIWDHIQPENALLRVWDHHTEFAQGIDWSPLVPGLVGSTSWDESVYVWHIDRDPKV